MTGDLPTQNRRVRSEEWALLAVVAPALAMAMLAVPSVAVLSAVGAIAAGVVVLGRWGRAIGRTVQIPLGVLGAAVPALLAPPGVSSAILATVAGGGILGWISIRSGTPAGPQRRMVALSLPIGAALVAMAIGLSSPGLSAGAGVAAGFLILALLLMALVIGVRRDPELRADPAADAPSPS